MGATLLDICRRCGVSTATVSRVVNGSPLVQERTRQRVLAAIEELGYRPSFAARNLARQRSDTIGVIFPQIESGFYVEVLRGIDDVAAEHGYHLLTAFAHGALDEQALVGRFLKDGRVDALILLNLLLPNGFVRKAARRGLPIALIDRPVAGTNLFAVSVDNRKGAREAILHLLGLGRRKIAIVAGPRGTYDSDQRVKGAVAAAAAAGVIIPGSRIWAGAFTEESGRAAMLKALQQPRGLPDAVFATNDEMAIGILRTLREKGIRVPEDVAVVGFDDSRIAGLLGLSSVRFPIRDMGRAAAEAAILQIKTGRAPKKRVVDARLVVRQSSGGA